MTVAFLSEPRGVSCEAHLQRAEEWLRLDGGRGSAHVLVYTAFELRLAIERHAYEFLQVINEGALSPLEIARCRTPDTLFALVREALPRYERLVEFTRLLYEAADREFVLDPVDYSQLFAHWARLGAYTSAPLDGPGHPFEAGDVELVRMVLRDLGRWPLDRACAVAYPAALPPEAASLFTEYSMGRIERSAALFRLRVMLPVLAARKEALIALVGPGFALE